MGSNTHHSSQKKLASSFAFEERNMVQNMFAVRLHNVFYCYNVKQKGKQGAALKEDRCG